MQSTLEMAMIGDIRTTQFDYIATPFLILAMFQQSRYDFETLVDFLLFAAGISPTRFQKYDEFYFDRCGVMGKTRELRQACVINDACALGCLQSDGRQLKFFPLNTMEMVYIQAPVDIYGAIL